MDDQSIAPPELFGNFQYEIYGRGLLGEVPKLPVLALELQERAREQMTPEAFGYVIGGAGAEQTVAANRGAFDRFQIVPRMLRDVSVRDLSIELLGTRFPAPVMLAPVGVQSIVHAEGELGSARAAAARGIPYIASTAASHTIEQIAQAAPGTRWYQLYWPRSRDLAASFIRRAEQAGYEAIVLTLDTWMLGWRPRDLHNAYLPFLKAEGVANYFHDPVFRDFLEKSPEEDQGAAIGQWALQFSNPSITWDELRWLRAQTELPILLKGILHPDDAARAQRERMDGVIVSNHGGRQVDGAISSLQALPAIRAAVGDRFPVLIDGGIRSGADILKALALGADCVCIGRPFVWGLALDGQAGVEHVLRCLLAELDLTLALSGYTSPSELTSSSLQPLTA